jgi:hypothetical protein
MLRALWMATSAFVELSRRQPLRSLTIDAQEKTKEAAGEFTDDDGAFIGITPAAPRDDEGDGEE